MEKDMATVTAGAGTSMPVAAARWRRDRRFFCGMAAAAAVATFVGFAPSYYLKAAYGTPVLPPLVHLHGFLFTSWIVLLVTQTSLVALGKTHVHRRLGIAGAVLAGVMTIVGFSTSLGAVRRGAFDVGFLVVPLGSVVVFPALVGAALVMRRKPDAHKRLMLIATAELLTAGIGRWPIMGRWGAPGFFAVTDMFVASLVMFDIATRRRVHPATLWGGLFFIASQPFRMAIGRTDTWIAFAGWLSRSG
jgi:hypothetical protein